MRRRDFIKVVAGSTVAWPFAARAQQKLSPLVGFLSGRSLSTDAHFVAAFRQGLSEIGYVEGQNLTIEFRWAEGQFDRLPGMVADLIGHQVSVIFAGGMDVQIRAVKDAISTTPAVYAVGGDPVEYGIVASMNRPGGNATAVTVLTAALWPKRLEILRELLPSIALIGILINPNNLTAETIANDVRTASRLLGVKIEVVNARNDSELDDAFAVLKQEEVGALLVMGDTLMNARRYQLISLANRYSLPSLYDRRDFPGDGGLMSYGASAVDQYLQSGRYVGRILNGEKPADLPALQPTRFELVINLKTAKALGLTVPQSLLVAADEVIE
jgi:putative tryptophan/tyrosine transport system substrate-binding protein